jgi:hypothetical protein
MIKSRRMRWVEIIAQMGEKINPNKVLVGRPEENSTQEDLGPDGNIIFKWALNK